MEKIWSFNLEKAVKTVFNKYIRGKFYNEDDLRRKRQT